MSGKNLSPEDRLDRVYRLMALMFLGVGTIQVIGALRYLIPAGSSLIPLVRWVKLGVAAVTLALCVLAIWKSLSFKRACAGCSLMAREGFVYEAIRKSGLRAGFVVFLALILMQAVAAEPALPARFFLYAALAVLELTFSLSFLVTSHVGGADE
jgi:hypothetical protein